ncbi:hypothetical protein Bca101_020118 [Brassica carinata]
MKRNLSTDNPTKHLKEAEAKASRGAQLMEKQKIEEDKQKKCNSRWSQDEGGEWGNYTFDKPNTNIECIVE